MKKVLFVASVDYHFTAFHLPYLRYFKEQGFEVHIASKKGKEVFEDVDVNHDVCFERFPFSKSNLRAYRLLLKIMNEHHFDIIHCHTPVAAMLTRLAARKARKTGTKVIYTAHGFHFYNGAPLQNWLLYFPIEWICSFFTDVLITINKEDYARAKKRLHAKQTFYVPGMGVDTEKFSNIEIDREAKRKEIGVPENAILLLSVGELNKNKNHEVIIRAMVKLNDPNIHYVIAGRGQLGGYLVKIANELGVGDQLHLLGFRQDIGELCKTADIFCFPSLREGLPVSLMEAMACGLPCVVSNIRGSVDLIKDCVDGYLCDPMDVTVFSEKIQQLAEDTACRKEMGLENKKTIQQYDISDVSKEIHLLYTRELSDFLREERINA